MLVYLELISGQGFLWTLMDIFHHPYGTSKTNKWFCKHRWSVVKRWFDESTGVFKVVQRCRWCDKWIHRTISVSDPGKLEMETRKIEEKAKTNVNRVGETRTSGDIGSIGETRIGDKSDRGNIGETISTE